MLLELVGSSLAELMRWCSLNGGAARRRSFAGRSLNEMVLGRKLSGRSVALSTEMAAARSHVVGMAGLTARQ